MRVPLHRLIGVTAATLCLTAAGTAQAQGKGHGKQHQQVQARDDDHHRDDHRDGDDRRRADDDRRRGDHDYDARYDRARAGTPPGLAKKGGVPPGLAKKPGGMPPGQYKKLYSTHQGASILSDVLGRRGYTVVRTADAGTSEYVYYRDRDGSLRRAVVSPGTDRLRFTNVPDRMLSEVLAKMY
jgi:uncharacterized protein involved in copper resistance